MTETLCCLVTSTGNRWHQKRAGQISLGFSLGSIHFSRPYLKAFSYLGMMVPTIIPACAQEVEAGGLKA
jgi:hypothetical protein